ncbi:MAG: hypothetical protein H6742_03170 [Alphaproteobacteria bacterium]|nr:hypothetical protein [Alphaproteobacteria bacterium]
MSFLLSLLLACSGAEYGVGKPDPYNDGGWPDLEVRIDVAYQDSVGGSAPGRCQLQVAFVPLQTETAEPTADADTGLDEPAEEPDRIAYPEEPGACAFSEVRPFPADPGGTDDNWQVAGAVVGPETVWLVGATREWELLPVEVEAGAYPDGGVRYELPDCSAEVFPFGEELALVVPEGAESDSEDDHVLPELRVEGAVVVGPRVGLLAPAADVGGLALVSVSEALDVEWMLTAAGSELEGAPADPSLTIQVNHQSVDTDVPVQWLVCAPDDLDAMRIPAASLGALTPDMGSDEAEWHTAIDVHATIATPEWETPWGRPVRVLATTSQGVGVQVVE